jgi:hypothetical protein
MKIGKLYQLKQTAKEARRLLGDVLPELGGGGYIINAVINGRIVSFGEDTLIVPLEIYSSSIDGSLLAGEYSKRLVALFPSGVVGGMYASIDKWEEVCE